MELIPWWIFTVKDLESVSPEEEKQAREIEKSLPLKIKTLGPTAPPKYFDPKEFVDKIKGYVDESVGLGWLTDPALTNNLKKKLDLAKSYIEADDPSQAEELLREFMQEIEQASSVQRTSEAYGLLYFNAKYLVEQLLFYGSS